MLLFVLVVAVLNLVLGAGLAVALSCDFSEFRLDFEWLHHWLARKQLTEPPEPAPHVAPVIVAPPIGEQAESDTPQPLMVDLPEGWAARLAASGVQPRSLVEAALHLVRVEEIASRDRWIAAEYTLRTATLKPVSVPPSALTPLCNEAANWITWARDVVTGLNERRADLGEYESWASELEELLADQIARMQGLRELGSAASQESEPDSAVRRFLHECSTLFEKAYALRDLALDRLGQLLVAEQRVLETPEVWRQDATLQYPNRLGIEAALAQWMQNDPQRQRPLSGVCIEIDRLGKLNERLGVQQTNHVVRAFARLVETTIRSERGDRIMRAGGSSIFVMLGDTPMAGAKVGAERVRQTIEAATFLSNSEEFTLAANCAVCELGAEETATQLLARLKAGIAEAKRGGRNRTAVDEGQGPILLDPQPIQVKAQSIPVGG